MAFAGRVQAVRRLVQHQQLRPGQQSSRQTEPLAHTQRETAETVVSDIHQTDLLQGVVDLAGPVGPIAAERGEGREVLPCGQRRIEPRSVNEPRHTLRHPQHTVDRRAQDLERALVRDGEPEQESKQRGLPGPIRANETVHLAAGDGDIYPSSPTTSAKYFLIPRAPT